MNCPAASGSPVLLRLHTELSVRMAAGHSLNPTDSKRTSMKKSEKQLLFDRSVGSLGVFVVIPMMWESLPLRFETAGPGRAETRKLDKANDDVAAPAGQVRRMVGFKDRSLSSNSSQGANAYQQWLTEHARVRYADSTGNRFEAAVSLAPRWNYKQFASESTATARLGSSGISVPLSPGGCSAPHRRDEHRSTRQLSEAAADAQDRGSSLAADADVKVRRCSVGRESIIAANTGGSMVIEDFPAEAPFEIRVGVNTSGFRNGRTWTLELADWTDALNFALLCSSGSHRFTRTSPSHAGRLRDVC